MKKKLHFLMCFLFLSLTFNHHLYIDENIQKSFSPREEAKGLDDLPGIISSIPSNSAKGFLGLGLLLSLLRDKRSSSIEQLDGDLSMLFLLMGETIPQGITTEDCLTFSSKFSKISEAMLELILLEDPILKGLGEMTTLEFSETDLVMAKVLEACIFEKK